MPRGGIRPAPACHPERRHVAMGMCGQCYDFNRRYCMDPEIARRWNLKADHGLTIEQYDAMVEAQGGLCLICKQPPQPGKRLGVDHDHSTGRIRGLLCHHCNAALGNFRDNVRLLEAAINYLLKYR